MSYKPWHKQLIERPKYAQGDVVEVLTLDGTFLWIEVEEVLEINGSQVLKAGEALYCACLVNVESLAFGGMAKKEGRL